MRIGVVILLDEVDSWKRNTRDNNDIKVNSSIK
jgi:hypothetical protein